MAAAAALLAGLLLIWIVSPNGPSDALFSDEHQLRTQLIPLLQEGHHLLRAGEPEVAARVLLRAQELAPGNAEITGLCQQADQEARDLQVYQRKSEEMIALLTQSRMAWIRVAPDEPCGWLARLLL